MADSARVASLLEQVLNRLSAIESHIGLEGAAGGAGGPGNKAVKEDARSIRAYDEYCRENLDPFVEAANALGGQAVELGQIVKDAWQAQRDFLQMASQVKEPSEDKLRQKIAPITAVVARAQRAVQRGDFENHGRAVAEGLQCLTWLVVKPAPRDFIENFVGASDFWANKIRVQYKKTNPQQTAFVDKFKSLILELMPYVKQWHTTGVAWNPQGVVIDSYVAGGSESDDKAAAPAPASSSSAPLPPAPKAEAKGVDGAGEATDGGKKALFGQLSQGLNITSGLKKVTKDQQTWRPEFKEGGAAPVAPPAPANPVGGSAVKGPKAAPVKGPPKSSYDSAAFRWNVENYVEGVTTVNVTDKIQSVYIYGCGAAVLDVRGKAKSVTIDNCKKTQVIVDELLSSLEVVNCHGVKVQVRNKVPTVAIDKTDGIVVILSKESMGVSFVTSKSSEMNVQYPKNDEGELLERPIPEQWQHRLVGDWPSLTFENSVSDLYGH